MRCGNCNKWPTLEMANVEAPELSVERSETGTKVTGEIKIALACADCGYEMKEATLEVNIDVVVVHKEGCEEGAPDSDALSVDFEPEGFHEFLPPGKKRHKHMYGAQGTITVTCECGGTGQADWRDSIQSSAMEELI